MWIARDRRKSDMGVEVDTWRAKFGSFCLPLKENGRYRPLRLIRVHIRKPTLHNGTNKLKSNTGSLFSLRSCAVPNPLGGNQCCPLVRWWRTTNTSHIALACNTGFKSPIPNWIIDLAESLRDDFIRHLFELLPRFRECQPHAMWSFTASPCYP